MAEPLAAIVLNEMVESIIREVLVGPIFDCTYLDIVQGILRLELAPISTKNACFSEERIHTVHPGQRYWF